MDDKLLNQIELSGAHHDYLATKPLNPGLGLYFLCFLACTNFLFPKLSLLSLSGYNLGEEPLSEVGLRRKP